MKIALLIFSCVLSCFSRGASVEWNTTFVMYEGSDLTGEHDDVYCLVNPYLLLYADISGSSLVLTALADSNLVNANTFVLATVGDVVSREYIDSFNRYFAYAEKGNWDSSHSDYQIVVDADRVVYLAYSRVLMDSDVPRYGWVALKLDESNQLSVVTSGCDLEGGSVVVGGGNIPEPSGCLLMVMGIAALGLRRAQRKTGGE